MMTQRPFRRQSGRRRPIDSFEGPSVAWRVAHRALHGARFHPV